MKFLLDEGVIVSAGIVLREAGHEVIFFNDSGIVSGSDDATVCTMALLNSAVLVAQDGDMKVLTRGHGAAPAKFPTLSLLKINCRESEAPVRVEQAVSLIEHEWQNSQQSNTRMLVTIGNNVITTHR